MPVYRHMYNMRNRSYVMCDVRTITVRVEYMISFYMYMYMRKPYTCLYVFVSYACIWCFISLDTYTHMHTHTYTHTHIIHAYIYLFPFKWYTLIIIDLHVWWVFGVPYLVACQLRCFPFSALRPTTTWSKPATGHFTATGCRTTSLSERNCANVCRMQLKPSHVRLIDSSLTIILKTFEAWGT